MLRAYIDNGIADEIITNFCSDESSKYVYKITGLRGSGKTVEYGKIIRTLKEKSNWLVYRERLINKHLVDGDTRGMLKIRLPKFDKFIEIWGED